MIEPGAIKSLYGRTIIVRQPVEIKTKRTWKERLFSKPWKPLEKFRYEYQQVVEDGQVIKTPDMFIMNPKTYRDFTRHLEVCD